LRRFEVAGAPHMPPVNTVGGMMRQVLYALVPGIVAHWWFFGPGIFFQIGLALFFALGFEAAMLALRRRPLKPFLSDYSAVVTAVLFALCLPPLAPWWVTLTGMGMAIVVAKHLYGGLGFNLFNPAMVGYAAVLIAFPQEMTAWLSPRPLAETMPGLAESARAILTGALPTSQGLDAITQATPLDELRTGVAENRSVDEVRQMEVFGTFGGTGWEWIAGLYLAGGLYLINRRVISWHVPAATLGTVVAITFPVWLFAPDTNPSPFQHLFSGALILGAFFIATDPVSGCSTMRGRLVFGVGVAILTLAIRRFGGYPDGVAFAVLLMNMCAPLIDRYTRPRTYGHDRKRKA